MGNDENCEIFLQLRRGSAAENHIFRPIRLMKIISHQNASCAAAVRRINHLCTRKS